MPGLSALWDSLVDCICRPPRDDYSYPDELVGGSRKVFRVGRCPGLREDLTLVNKRGLRLQCSHYVPRHVRGKDGRLPCVIYCHCNSGSRRDAEEAICVLIPQGVSVFTLDFAGSGLSEGQWVTLGAEEVEDVACVVEHLRAGGRVSTLGLWGRSMGAVTALLYSQRDPSIAGMVLDSPFSRLTDLMLEIVQEQRLPIPRPLARLALAAMRRSVMKRAGFDITKVNPLDAVSRSFIPALFGHATGDTFIRITHAEALFGAYAGDKNLIRFDGDHNSRRPEFFYNSVSIFWHNTLQLEELLEPADSQQIAASQSAAAAGGRPSAAQRSLRPPPPSNLQPRVRTPLSPMPAAPAAVAGAAAAGPATAGVAAAGAAAAGPAAPPRGAEGLARSSSGSELLPAGPAGAAAGGGDRDAGLEDEVADVAGPNGAHRSTPWEPRLWETELDKTLLERQRFRRMAGGLPSPPGTSVDASSVGPGGSHFRNSTELRNLLANGSDDSVVRRLLGEDPHYSDTGNGTPAGRQFTDAAPAAGAVVPAPPPAAGSVGLATGLWLPSTEEEEEAQLRAALELSLLELAANEAEDARAVAPGASVGPGAGAEQGLTLAQAQGNGAGSGAAAPKSTGLGQPALGPPFFAEHVGARSASGATPGLPAAAASAEERLWQHQRQELLLQMALEELQQGGPQSREPAEGAVTAGSSTERSALAGGARETERSGPGGPSGGPALASAGETGALRSSLTFPHGADAELRAPSLGGRSFSHEDARSANAAPVVAPPPLTALSGPQQPSGSSTASQATGDPTSDPRRSAASGPSSAAAMPVPALPAASGVGGGGRGASLYDLYTDEELLALAVQLSLQDTGAAGGAAAAAPAAASLA